MSTPVQLGATRQFCLANLTDSAPAWSFLEDAVGTTVRSAQVGRTIRLGDPINVGPNSEWHQLTWEGGEKQDIWKDEQMYQYGDVDVLTNSGKVRMWPGLQSWMKLEQLGRARGVAMSQGTRTDTAPYQAVLYVATRDIDPHDEDGSIFFLWQIHPGYARGDTRAVQLIHFAVEPYRFIIPYQFDDGTAGVQLVATRTHMYQLVESTHVLNEDVAAPGHANASMSYTWDTAANYNDAIYYAHGNNLYKRIPKPPYGVLGQHTKVKRISSAWYLRGMTVWNNRLYFGAQYPSNRAAVFVSDGATTTKAFDFPQSFTIFKMKEVAGALYIIGHQSSDVHGTNLGSGNMVQQLWRYDGSSLKKLWQEGKFSDGEMHWGSDLAEWEGMVVWGRHGTTAGGGRANIMCYDPVRDSIVRGPGIDLNVANQGNPGNGKGVFITSLGSWHNTVAAFFKDETDYSEKVRRPGVLTTIRSDSFPKNDLRWHTTDMLGDAAQFKASTAAQTQDLLSSEYHGTDDVAVEQKEWLSVRLRYRITGADGHLRLYMAHPNGKEWPTLDTDFTFITQLDFPGTTGWVEKIVPLKDPGTGLYLKSQKLQIGLRFKNDSTDYDSVSQVWVDDVAVQWYVAPKKVRQWQIRVPVTTGQTRLDASANPLATTDALGDQLENLYFAGAPLQFWKPSNNPTLPVDTSAAIEVRIADFQRQQAMLATDEGTDVGYVTLTLVENVLQ